MEKIRAPNITLNGWPAKTRVKWQRRFDAGRQHIFFLLSKWWRWVNLKCEYIIDSLLHILPFGSFFFLFFHGSVFLLKTTASTYHCNHLSEIFTWQSLLPFACHAISTTLVDYIQAIEIAVVDQPQPSSDQLTYYSFRRPDNHDCPLFINKAMWVYCCDILGCFT